MKNLRGVAFLCFVLTFLVTANTRGFADPWAAFDSQYNCDIVDWRATLNEVTGWCDCYGGESLGCGGELQEIFCMDWEPVCSQICSDWANDQGPNYECTVNSEECQPDLVGFVSCSCSCWQT